MTEYWIGPEPQLHIACAGAGATHAVLLTGMTHAATRRAEALSSALGGRGVVAIDLPSQAGEPIETIVQRIAGFIGSGDGALPLIVADDVAGGLAALIDGALKDRPARKWLIGGPRVRDWQARNVAPPAVTPVLDGTHLQRLWHFLRDLHIDATDAVEIPDAEALSAAFVEAARKPEAYRALWHALLALPLSAWAEADELSAVAGQGSGIALAPIAPGQRRMIATPRGQMHVRIGAGDGPPLLFLHHGPGATPVIDDVIADFGAGRATFAPDFLGCGRSDRIDAPVDIETLARDVIALLDALKVETVDIFGTHTGALVGLELAVKAPHRTGRLILEGFTPPITADADAIMRPYPLLTPTHNGAHLAEAWGLRRDMFRFAPFFAPTRAAQRHITAADAPFLHRWTMTLLRGAPTFRHVMRAAFAYDGAAALRRLTRPALICAGIEDSLHAGLALAKPFAADGITIRETPATLWHPGQDAGAVAATLQIYRDFLDG